MIVKRLLPWLLLALLLPLTLCAGCATEPRVLAQPAPRLPLPQEARQPPVDPMCQPTCSDGLARLLDGLLPLPTSAAGPAPSASSSAR